MAADQVTSVAWNSLQQFEIVTRRDRSSDGAKPFREDHKLARPNYSGEKRRKDLAKKAKKEEKRLRKLHAKENPASDDDRNG